MREGTGTYFTLVQGKHHGAFDRFIEIVIIGIGYGFKKNIRDSCLPVPSSPVSGSRCILHDQAAVVVVSW